MDTDTFKTAGQADHEIKGWQRLAEWISGSLNVQQPQQDREHNPAIVSAEDLDGVDEKEEVADKLVEEPADEFYDVQSGLKAHFHQLLAEEAKAQIPGLAAGDVTDDQTRKQSEEDAQVVVNHPRPRTPPQAAIDLATDLLEHLQESEEDVPADMMPYSAIRERELLWITFEKEPDEYFDQVEVEARVFFSPAHNSNDLTMASLSKTQTRVAEFYAIRQVIRPAIPVNMEDTFEGVSKRGPCGHTSRCFSNQLLNLWDFYLAAARFRVQELEAIGMKPPASPPIGVQERHLSNLALFYCPCGDAPPDKKETACRLSIGTDSSGLNTARWEAYKDWRARKTFKKSDMGGMRKSRVEAGRGGLTGNVQ